MCIHSCTHVHVCVFLLGTVCIVLFFSWLLFIACGGVAIRHSGSAPDSSRYLPRFSATIIVAVVVALVETVHQVSYYKLETFLPIVALDADSTSDSNTTVCSHRTNAWWMGNGMHACIQQARYLSCVDEDISVIRSPTGYHAVHCGMYSSSYARFNNVCLFLFVCA